MENNNQPTKDTNNNKEEKTNLNNSTQNKDQNKKFNFQELLKNFNQSGKNNSEIIKKEPLMKRTSTNANFLNMIKLCNDNEKKSNETKQLQRLENEKRNKTKNDNREIRQKNELEK